MRRTVVGFGFATQVADYTRFASEDGRHSGEYLFTPFTAPRTTDRCRQRVRRSAVCRPPSPRTRASRSQLEFFHQSIARRTRPGVVQAGLGVELMPGVVLLRARGLGGLPPGHHQSERVVVPGLLDGAVSGHHRPDGAQVVLAVVAPPAGGEVAANRLAAGGQNVPELRASALDDREGDGSVQDVVFRAVRALFLVGPLPLRRVAVLDGRACGRKRRRQVALVVRNAGQAVRVRVKGREVPDRGVGNRARGGRRGVPPGKAPAVGDGGEAVGALKGRRLHFEVILMYCPANGSPQQSREGASPPSPSVAGQPPRHLAPQSCTYAAVPGVSSHHYNRLRTPSKILSTTSPTDHWG